MAIKLTTGKCHLTLLYLSIEDILFKKHAILRTRLCDGYQAICRFLNLIKKRIKASHPVKGIETCSQLCFLLVKLIIALHRPQPLCPFIELYSIRYLSPCVDRLCDCELPLNTVVIHLHGDIQRLRENSLSNRRKPFDIIRINRNRSQRRVSHIRPGYKKINRRRVCTFGIKRVVMAFSYSLICLPYIRVIPLHRR